MPYIKQEKRKKWQELLEKVNSLVKTIPTEEIDGELNYFITKILISCYSPSYFNYNRAVGLLECIKQELYRRKIAPYEDKKMQENSDI